LIAARGFVGSAAGAAAVACGFIGSAPGATATAAAGCPVAFAAVDGAVCSEEPVGFTDGWSDPGAFGGATVVAPGAASTSIPDFGSASALPPAAASRRTTAVEARN
jgi:hypothetical protein